MRVWPWLIALALSLAGSVWGLLLHLDRPPCENFIDGPCSDPEPLLFAGWWLLPVSGVVFAFVGIAFVARIALAIMRRSTRHGSEDAAAS